MLVEEKKQKNRDSIVYVRKKLYLCTLNMDI